MKTVNPRKLLAKEIEKFRPKNVHRALHLPRWSNEARWTTARINNDKDGTNAWEALAR